MNLILGTMWNGDFSDYRLFFESFARVNRREDILIIFTSNMVGNPPDNTLFIPFARDERVHPNCQRFMLYYEFLKLNKYAENILLTDCRDVYFLGDPFFPSLPAGLNVFLEDASMTIGKCQFNSEWVKTVWGLENSCRLSEKPISCAGVTIGDYEYMVEYLAIMAWNSDNHVNVDQGAHNGIVHFDKIERCNIHSNDTGPVLTMGYMQNPKISDLGKYAIIHQYDRHPEIKAYLEKRHEHPSYGG